MLRSRSSWPVRRRQRVALRGSPGPAFIACSSGVCGLVATFWRGNVATGRRPCLQGIRPPPPPCDGTRGSGYWDSGRCWSVRWSGQIPMSDMARRVTIRLDDASEALLEAEAGRCGVSLGGLIREAAVRAARDVGRQVSAGDVKLRARSARVPVPGAGRESLVGAASSLGARAVGREQVGGDPASSGLGESVGAGAGAPVVARRPVPVDPGVARAVAFRRFEERRRAGA